MDSVSMDGMKSTNSRDRMNKRKLYIIHSEYVQQGITFNRKDRYVDDPEKANQIYEETLQAMKEDNDDMFTSPNYQIQSSSRKGNKYFICFCKSHPMTSNFSVEMKTAELE